MMKYASFLVLALGILIAVFGCTTSSIYDVNDENRVSITILISRNSYPQ